MSMIDSSHPPIPARYLARIESLLEGGQRALLGLAGAPGSGKSTLALALQSAFPAVSVVVPMDGFHLANAQLRHLGRDQRKGAPDTFDVAGFVNLLRRLRDRSDGEIVYAPEFRREIEEPVAGAIAIEARTPLIIIEGNYLLLDRPGWCEVASYLDETWYVGVDDALRTDRLTRRHEQFGRSREQAVEWVARTDAPNATLVDGSAHRADVSFDWNA